jgi:hypothetical protein
MSADSERTSAEDDERLVVERDDRARCRILRGPAKEPGGGEVRLRIERFGMTSNNVTYAALNRVMPYLDFFAAPGAEGAGVLPVWGIARVEASRHADVPAGARYFGFFPAARFVTLAPAVARAGGFGVEHPGVAQRYALYGQYQRTDADPFHLPDQEDALVVLRPLFLTGLALADYLSTGASSEVEAIVVSSASSKTSYGLGAALRGRGERRRVIGISSRANVAFVASLGVYDQVVAYDDIATIGDVRSAVYVDVAGSGAVRAAIVARLGAGLRLTVVVGMSHGEAGGYAPSGAEGATEVFFAPGWMARRRKELGDAFSQGMLDGWRAQMAGVEGRFAIQRRHGGEAARETYLGLVEHGGASAGAAFVVDI